MTVQHIKNIGIFFTVTFSISSGITNAWALVSFHIIHNLILSWLAPFLLFLAVTGMNVRIFKRAVPNVLYDIFGGDYLLQGILTKKGRLLTRGKMVTVIIGLAFALAAGITMAALIYQGIFKGLSDLTINFGFLQFLSPIGMPAAALFASATLVCITSLMFEAIANIVKTNNIRKKFKDFIFDLINTDPSLPRNKDKSYYRVIFERVITVTLITLLTPLACAGLVMTTKACCTGLAGLIGSTVSKVIAYGFAMTAQIPFTVKTMANSVANLFEPIEDPKTQTTCNNTITCLGFYFLRLVYALGNGLIAMLGAQTSIESGIAASGGIANSLASTSDTKMIIDRCNIPPDQLRSPPFSPSLNPTHINSGDTSSHDYSGPPRLRQRSTRHPQHFSYAGPAARR